MFSVWDWLQAPYWSSPVRRKLLPLIFIYSRFKAIFFICSLFPLGHYLLWWVRFSLVLGLGMMSGLGLLRVSNLYSRVRVSLGL